MRVHAFSLVVGWVLGFLCFFLFNTSRASNPHKCWQMVDICNSIVVARHDLKNTTSPTVIFYCDQDQIRNDSLVNKPVGENKNDSDTETEEPSPEEQEVTQEPDEVIDMIDANSNPNSTISNPVEPGSVTIVAMWFFLDKSKWGNPQYVQWAKTFCQLETNIYFWYDCIS